MKAHFRHQTKILLVGILSIGLLVTGCQTSSVTVGQEKITSVQIEPVQETIGDLIVSVDPRIELLTTVQRQASYKLLTWLDYAYARESKEAFSAFQNNQGVKTSRKLSNSGFAYDAPPHAILYCLMPDQLTIEQPFSEELISRAGGKAKLEKFMKALSAFSTQSNFAEFFNSHRSFYQNQVNEVVKIMEKEHYTKTINDFFNMPHGNYRLILSLSDQDGGYGPSMKNAEGEMDIYGIIGPDSVIDDVPVYKQEFLEHMILHEFSHSYVNPLADKHQADVDALKDLFKPIEKEMNEHAYNKWETCLNEHIIRAVNARFVRQKEGEVEAKIRLVKEYGNGFIYIEPLYNALAKYEANRDTYKSFDAFYPELLKALSKGSTSSENE
jgi:hypothetical protein